jgi:hypothetical protein
MIMADIYLPRIYGSMETVPFSSKKLGREKCAKRFKNVTINGVMYIHKYTQPAWQGFPNRLQDINADTVDPQPDKFIFFLRDPYAWKVWADLIKQKSRAQISGRPTPGLTRGSSPFYIPNAGGEPRVKPRVKRPEMWSQKAGGGCVLEKLLPGGLVCILY